MIKVQVNPAKNIREKKVRIVDLEIKETLFKCTQVVGCVYDPKMKKYIIKKAKGVISCYENDREINRHLSADC